MTLRRTRGLLIAALLCTAPALAQASAPPAPPPARATNLPSAPQPQAAAKTPVPAAPGVPYVPLTAHQKFHIFLEQTHSPYTFISAGLDATYAQMTGEPYAYGGGFAGYGKRYGAALANEESGRFFNGFLFPTLLHQDPRYLPAKPGSNILQRMTYAASRVLITRADSGRSTLNSSELLGTLSSVSLANAYYPASYRGFGDTMSRFGGALLSDAGSNVLREFWPDIARVFRRHEPKKLKKIEQKIPRKVRDAAQRSLP
jgi:hypothetical protein